MLVTFQSHHENKEKCQVRALHLRICAINFTAPFAMSIIVLFINCLDGASNYEGGLKSKFRFVITFLFFIVHT